MEALQDSIFKVHFRYHLFCEAFSYLLSGHMFFFEPGTRCNQQDPMFPLNRIFMSCLDGKVYGHPSTLEIRKLN